MTNIRKTPCLFKVSLTHPIFGSTLETPTFEPPLVNSLESVHESRVCLVFWYSRQILLELVLYFATPLTVRTGNYQRELKATFNSNEMHFFHQARMGKRRRRTGVTTDRSQQVVPPHLYNIRRIKTLPPLILSHKLPSHSKMVFYHWLLCVCFDWISIIALS